MVEKEPKSIVEVRITELEEKLINIIEMANNYPNIPAPVFEQEIEEVLAKIERLFRLK